MIKKTSIDKIKLSESVKYNNISNNKDMHVNHCDVTCTDTDYYKRNPSTCFCLMTTSDVTQSNILIIIYCIDAIFDT